MWVCFGGWGVGVVVGRVVGRMDSEVFLSTGGCLAFWGHVIRGGGGGGGGGGGEREYADAE